jgi:hypothetical protein
VVINPSDEVGGSEIKFVVISDVSATFEKTVTLNIEVAAKSAIFDVNVGLSIEVIAIVMPYEETREPIIEFGVVINSSDEVGKSEINFVVISDGKVIRVFEEDNPVSSDTNTCVDEV